MRIRVTKSEVAQLADTGFVEEQIVFPGNTFIYALQSSETSQELSASLQTNKIIVLVPKLFAQKWAGNEVVGIEAKQPVAENEWLTLLLEKDFVCMDETTEDQGDNFENPKKTAKP